MASSGPSKLKQRRLQGSCDLCRQKKVKCDSAKMPGFRCTNCIAFDSECTHFHVTKKTMYNFGSMGSIPPPPVLKGLNLPDAKPLMKSLIDAILSPSYQPPTNPAQIHETMSTLAQFARMLDEALESATESLASCDASRPLQPSTSNSSSTSRRSASPTTTRSSESASSASVSSHASPAESGAASASGTAAKKEPDNPLIMADISSLSDNLRQGLMLDSYAPRFYGPSSTVMVAKSTLDISLGKNTEWTVEASVTKYRRPQYWTHRPWEAVQDPEYPPYVFPEPDLLHDLVNTFFTCTNPLLPLLHRQTFDYALNSGLHLVDEGFGGTVLGVCAVAPLYTRDPRVLLEEAGYSEQSGGFKYYRQLRLTKESFLLAPTLHDLQVHALAIFYLHSTSKCEKCWQLTGTALRAAQDIALNRKRMKEGGPTIEDELRKRVFFTLLMYEEIMAAYMGRSAMIKPYDFDVDLPVECDDEFWQNDEHPELAFKEPEGVPAKASYFIQMIKLLGILADVQQAFYSVKKPAPPVGMTLDDWNAERLIEYDTALEKWMQNLPEHLRWNPDAPHSLFFDQAAILHAKYYWVQILLHRPFIGEKTKNRATMGFMSLAVCRNAARATILLMDVQSRKGVIIPWVAVVLFLSGIILLVNMWRGKQMGVDLDEEQEMQSVYKAIRVLRTYERGWHGAGRFCDVLYSLLMLNGFSEPLEGTTEQGGSTSWDPIAGSNAGADTSALIMNTSFNGALGTTVTATDLSASSLPQFSIDHPNYPHPATISNAMSVMFDALNFPQAHVPTSGIQDFDSMGFNQIDALAGVPIGFDWPEWGTYIANYEAQTPLQQATPVPGADPSSNAAFRFF